MATQSITINNISKYPELNGFDNVICTVRYDVVVTNEITGKTVKRLMISNIPFSDTNFVPYEDLTEADVISWIEADKNYTSAISSLVKMVETVDTKINVTHDNFPWVVAAAEKLAAELAAAEETSTEETPVE